MARLATISLWIFVALSLPACGGGEAPVLEAGSNAADPAGWVGDEPVALDGPSPHLRVIAYLRPGHAPSRRVAQALEALHVRHPQLAVVGLTMGRDRKAVEAFRREAGVSFPLYFGLEAEERASRGLQQAPSVQVWDEHGDLVARDLASLMARL